MQLSALALVDDSDSDIDCPVCVEHCGDQSATCGPNASSGLT